MTKEHGALVMRLIAQRGLFVLVFGLCSLTLVASAQPVPVEDEDEPPVAAVAPASSVEPARAEKAPRMPSAKPSAPTTKPVAAATGADGLARSIVHVADADDAIGERWRKRLAFLEARDSKRASEQLAEIERLQQTLSFANLFSVSTALVKEARALLAAGNSAEALVACRMAANLSPDLPETHACVAQVLIATSPSSVGAIYDAVKNEYQARFRDLRSRRNLLANEAMTFVLAMVIACGLWVLLLILRYAGLFFHDFHHLFPRGVPRWQSVVVAVVLVALPALLGLGVLGSVAAAAIGVSFFLSRGESIALGVAFVVLAASQFIVAEAARGGALGSLAHDVYLLERGEGARAAVERIERRLAGDAKDANAAFALARHYKRLGRYRQAEQHYATSLKLDPNSAETLNNLANVHFLQGETDKAIELYQRANASRPDLAEPLHNLAKMYFREGRLAQGEQAQQAAIALGGHRVVDRIGLRDDPRANLFVVDLVLPVAAIETVAANEAESVKTFEGPVLKSIAGTTGSRAAAGIALASAFFVLSAAALRRRLRPATKCEKCGRPVCARCDPELTATSGLCGQCISVFVRRTGVDAPNRIRKEISVRRYRRREVLLRRLAGVFVGGGGHVLSGRLVSGALYLVAFSNLLSQAVFWNGFLPSPVALAPVFSPYRAGVFATAIVALYVVSVRHLVRSEGRE